MMYELCFTFCPFSGAITYNLAPLPRLLIVRHVSHNKFAYKTNCVILALFSLNQHAHADHRSSPALAHHRDTGRLCYSTSIFTSGMRICMRVTIFSAYFMSHVNSGSRKPGSSPCMFECGPPGLQAMAGQLLAEQNSFSGESLPKIHGNLTGLERHFSITSSPARTTDWQMMEETENHPHSIADEKGLASPTYTSHTDV